MAEPISSSFNINFQCLNIFGIWPRKLPSRSYKCSSFFCLFTFLIVYDAVLTVNLFYTPLQVNLIIEELMFYFYDISVMTKVGTIILWRNEIFEILNILDSDFFKGNDSVSRQIVIKAVHVYKISWKLHAFLCHFSFFFGAVLSVLLYFLPINNEIKFPVSKYHLISVETRQLYFGYIYAYQFIGIYLHMMFTVNIDSLFAGLLFYAITQIKVLCHELRSLQWNKQSAENNVQEKSRIYKLNYCLLHYESILKYCASVQDLYSLSLFVQMVTSSAIICSVLCTLLLPDTKVVFTLTYLAEMTLEIYVPAWLGTQLIEECQQLVFAAYDSDWVSRSKPYKNSLKLFMERANTPVTITGMKFFALNLETFVVIMRTAYSFIMLVRNFQERN